MDVPGNSMENQSMSVDFVVSEKSESLFVNVDDTRCNCSPLIFKEKWKTDCRAVNLEICECSAEKKLRKEDNVLLNCNVSANRGIIHQYTECWTPRLLYLIGIPFGWLLFGMFQYFVCIIVLGDSFLDPKNFTYAWIMEIICTIPIILIITIVKCLYVRVDILEYCEKITWTGFTFIIFQGLAIILLLLPISNLFKYFIGDFSQPINFFIYWMIFAFPHIIILCFTTFGCCSKMFRSFTRYLRYVHSLDKKEQENFKKENHQMTLNKDNNFELQDLNYSSVFCSNKNLQSPS